MPMNNKIVVKGRTFATERSCGVFELRSGAYMQHRGTAKCFSTTKAFRRYVQLMLKDKR